MVTKHICCAWQPIETYDNLPFSRKPAHAVFWMKGSTKSNLSAGVAPIRNYGNREITHWMEIGAPDAL